MIQAIFCSPKQSKLTEEMKYVRGKKTMNIYSAMPTYDINYSHRNQDSI